MTKEDLKDMDIVTLRNGDKLVFVGEEFINITENAFNFVDDLDDFYDDLTYIHARHDNDIIKVDRPKEYETLFTRTKAKEMTVAEISEALGYEVKVIK